MSHEAGQLVRSPEQVELFLPIAGPTTRILAFAIDAIVMLVLQVAIWAGLLFGMPAFFEGFVRRILSGLGDPANWKWNSDTLLLFLAVILAMQFLLEFGYFVFFEWATGGQSIGKRWLRIRVVQDGGFPMAIRQSLVRNLLRMVDSLPSTYVVGLIAVLVSDEGKRLGDLAAGTVVVRLDRPPPAPPLPDLPAEARATFVFDRAQIARIGPIEVTLALETLRRLDVLDVARGAEALARTTAVLCTRLEHPPIEPRERAAFLRAVLDAAGVR